MKKQRDEIDANESMMERLTQHLDDSATSISFEQSSPSRARREAHARVIRRRRAVVGSALVASTVGVVVGVQQLTQTAPSAITTTQEPPSESDTAPGDTNNAPGAGTLPTNTAPAITAPATDISSTPEVAKVVAQQGDPAFVWRVVDPGQDASLNGASNNGPIGRFPTFAMATAPGRSADYDDTEYLVWHTDDGVSWTATDIESPFGQNYWRMTPTNDRIFAVSTAPGVAAAYPNPLRLAVSDGDDWSHIDLPFDMSEVGPLELAQSHTEVATIPYGDGVLIAATSVVQIDWEGLAAANDVNIEDSRVTDVDAEGITLVATSCFEEFTVPSAVLLDQLIGANDGEASPTAPITSDPAAACDTSKRSWDEVGVPSATVDAVQEINTRFFLVAADLTVAEIDAPPGGGHYSSTGGRRALFHERGADQSPSEQAIEYVDDMWVDVDIETATYDGLNGYLVGDRTMGLRSTQDGSHFVTVGLDKTIVHASLDGLFGDNSSGFAEQSSATDSRWVGVLQIVPDPIAEAGGVEATFGTVTVRRETSGSNLQLLDSETGQPIERSRISINQDGQFTITDENGAVQAEFNYDAAFSQIYEQSDYDKPASHKIVTTSDGITFSVESVAGLLGVDDVDITFIPRVSTDGTTVVIAVTLNDRYPDGTRKQLTLVGTPIG